MKNILYFTIFILCLIPFQSYSQKVISIQPDGINDVLVIKTAIETAKTYVGESVIIKLGGGTYNLHRTQATALKYYISNTLDYSVSQTNIKNIGLFINGAKDLTIDGEGAKLITHGEMTSVLIDRSQNVTLKNFSVDAADPTVTEMTVESINGNQVIYKAHTTSNYTVSGNTLKWIGEYGWNFTSGPCQLYDPVQDITFRTGNPMDNSTALADLGNKRISITYSTLPSVKVGYTFQMRDGVRDQVAGFIHKSANVTLDHINYFFMGNFGIVCQYSDNLNFFGCRFAPEMGSGRTNAGFADFLQISGCKGLVKVEDSYFSGAHDDPINVHGTYLKIQTYNTTTQVKVKFMHNQSWGFDAFFVGDSIEFIDVASMMGIQTAKITAVTRNDDQNITLTFDQPVDIAAFQAKTKGVVVENITWTPEVEIRRNYFSRIPTRGILLTTRRRSVIEDNTFYKMQMAGVYISGDAASWYESGKVSDLTIRNNNFIECGSPVIYFDPTNSVNGGYVHSNIVIDHNRFQIATGSALGGKSVDKVQFINNTIITSNSGTADSFANLSNSGLITKSSNVKFQPGTIIMDGLTVTASSSLSTNEKVLAIDANATTSWKPAIDDTEKWWKVDISKTYCLNRIRLIFPQAGVWKYVIEVSNDNTNWTKVIDQSTNTTSVTLHFNTGNLGRNVRYVRIAFNSTTAGLAEVNLYGEPTLPAMTNILNGTVIGTTGSYKDDASVTRDAAFDYNINSYFDAPSTSASAWVGLDLGADAAFKIDSIRFAPRSSDLDRMLNGTFEISNSPTFVPKTILYTVSTKPTTGYTLVPITDISTGRYVRYSGSTNSYGNISEIEFYGKMMNTELVAMGQNEIHPKVTVNRDNRIIKIISPDTDGYEQKISLFSITGTLLCQHKTLKKNNVIDYKKITRGNYIVQVTGYKTFYSVKIIL